MNNRDFKLEKEIKRKLSKGEESLIKAVNRNYGHYSWRTKEIVKKLEAIKK